MRTILFGSLQTTAREGGDIDFLISTVMIDTEEIVRAEIDVQMWVQRLIAEQKTDVLVDYPGRGRQTPIFETANALGPD